MAQDHDHGSDHGSGHGPAHQQGSAQDHGHHHGPALNHGHDHTHMDFSQMLPLLVQEAELFTPAYAEAAEWLREQQPEPGLIVDAGSGPGVISCLLAERFPGARVVAVDGAEPLLAEARVRAERLGVADRFSTVEAELSEGVGDLEDPADLLWASRSLHHVGDQRAALAGFVRASRQVAPSPCWRAACPRASSRATPASAGPAWRPASTRCTTSGSPACGPSCPDR